MYTITLTTDPNFQKLLKKFGGMSKEITDAARKALVKSVVHVSSKVLGSGRVPYLRGDLRRSILPFYSGMSGTGDLNMEGGVGTDKVYAPIHELGLAVTRHSAWGRPTRPYIAQYKERAFLRVPFQEAQPQIERFFHEEMEKAAAIA
jgi:hypothetical protein